MLLRAGMQPSDMVARVTGDAMSDHGRAIADRFRRPDFTQARQRESWRPASPGMIARLAWRPWRWHPGRLASAVLPEGAIELGDMAAGIRQLFEHAWPARRLWIPAMDVATGRRVVFGSPDSPDADIGTAVTSSGAVPGVCRPVRSAGRRYVDGGMLAVSNVDLAARDRSLDLVIVSSPLSRFAPLRWTLRRGLRRLARQGTAVWLVEPGAEVVRAMGWNPMDERRAAPVAHAVGRAALPPLQPRLPTSPRGRWPGSNR